MSTYSENKTCKETQDTASVIWKILMEMGKSPSTYKKYAEKTVEEVANEIKKVKRIGMWILMPPCREPIVISNLGG